MLTISLLAGTTRCLGYIIVHGSFPGNPSTFLHARTLISQLKELVYSAHLVRVQLLAHLGIAHVRVEHVNRCCSVDVGMLVAPGRISGCTCVRVRLNSEQEGKSLLIPGPLIDLGSPNELIA